MSACKSTCKSTYKSERDSKGRSEVVNYVNERVSE